MARPPQPPYLQPGPLTWESAGSLNRFLEAVAKTTGGFDAIAPLSVIEDATGVHFSVDLSELAETSAEVVEETANFTITNDQDLYLFDCDCTSGNITGTLPASAGVEELFGVFVRRKDSSSHTLTVATSSGDTIDGAATVSLPTQYSTAWLVYIGSGTWSLRLWNPALLTVVDITGTPGPFTGTTTLKTVAADGLSISQPSAGVVKMDLLAASATQTGTMTTGTQTFVGNKTFNAFGSFGSTFNVAATTTTIAGSVTNITGGAGGSNGTYVGAGGPLFLNPDLAHGHFTTAYNDGFSFPFMVTSGAGETAILLNPGTISGVSAGPSTLYFDNTDLVYLRYTPNAGLLGGVGPLTLQNVSTTGGGTQYGVQMWITTQSDGNNRSSFNLAGTSSLGTFQRVNVTITDDTGTPQIGVTGTDAIGNVWVSGWNVSSSLPTSVPTSALSGGLDFGTS